MGVLHPVGKTTDFQPGDATSVVVGNKAIALYCVDGRFFASDDSCPHAGAPLSSGFVEDGIVTCPMHHWQFRLSDGVLIGNPKKRIACYPVHIDGEIISIEVPATGEISGSGS